MHTTPSARPKPAAARAARASRSDQVYAQLKHDIADFNLVPGDRFTEMELCERLDVSRTPVRQALYRLQQEGYVEVLFRAGWRVLPFDFDQFEQLYDLRMVLETTAVQRLCEDAAGADRSALEALAAIWLVPQQQRVGARPDASDALPRLPVHPAGLGVPPAGIGHDPRRPFAPGIPNHAMPQQPAFREQFQAGEHGPAAHTGNAGHF